MPSRTTNKCDTGKGNPQGSAGVPAKHLLPLREKDTEAWRGVAEPSRSWMRGGAPSGARARESAKNSVQDRAYERLRAMRLRRAPSPSFALGLFRPEGHCVR